MNKDYIEVTHTSEQDYNEFRQSIDAYDNPTYEWSGRVESRTNSDGTITTTLEREAIRDYTTLGENIKLTGGSLEIGTDD